MFGERGGERGTVFFPKRAELALDVFLYTDLRASSLRVGKNSGASQAQPFGAFAPGRGRAQLHPKYRHQGQASISAPANFVERSNGDAATLALAMQAGSGPGITGLRELKWMFDGA
ncbi:MAG: hypothetical protein S4CHLAM102_08560 [Chlamydiia bacterium]|nr:hypothetical protein [Chlamydiia bacterium]